MNSKQEITNKLFSYFFIRKKCQLIYLIAVIALNSVYYLSVIFFHDIQQDNTKLNSSNATQKTCVFLDYSLISIDLINVLIPSILMLILTIVLIVTLKRMRTRMLQTFRSENNRVFRKNIQLITALISMNVSYLILSLPWNIIGFFQVKGFVFELLLYIFYIPNVCNFYYLLAVNNYFRNGFLHMIRLKKQ